jgi:hypothetical protein
MTLYQQILDQITEPANKNLLEVGAHDDSLTNQLAKSFRHVYAYYEYVKIPERQAANITIRKKPFPTVLKHLHDYDVLLMENEFHHFSDIWQMQTYDALKTDQTMLLVEWDFTGNVNQYYSAFQNCRPLCDLTREILEKFSQDEQIEITNIIKGKYQDTINSSQEMTEYFQFILPDHWKYGEKEFMQRIAAVEYPTALWEGYDLFIINKME